MNDRQSIRLIRQGDLQAFERLFRKYYESLCQWAHHYLKDRDSAEEVVQDLFYRIWRDHGALKIHTSVKSYLYMAVSNNCRMILNQKNRRSVIESELARDEQNPPAQPAELLETSEIRQVVEQTLEELPERPATIFRMSRYEGMKYREIAEKLSISVKTVESNMGKALELFRKKLQEYL
jgi:RNA polymerase sigma-70 factor (ECF subfamily)